MTVSFIHRQWLRQRTENSKSDTRWACRHIACHSYMDSLSAIISVSEEMDKEERGNSSGEDKCLLAQMDFW